MDAVTIGAVLLAIISGAGGELGSRLWEGLVSLIHSPFQHKAAAGGSAAAATVVPSGAAELAALERAPADEQKAVALAELLLARATVDGDFRRALEAWWHHAEPIRTNTGDVTNTISGGTQHGPVLQGRDFSNVSLGATPAGPPVPPPEIKGAPE
jgi:hypothetical protein